MEDSTPEKQTETQEEQEEQNRKHMRQEQEAGAYGEEKEETWKDGCGFSGFSSVQIKSGRI